MLNRVVLVGRLTRDLELKYSQSGVAVCRFSIAVNRAFKNGNGETEADFPNVVTFRKTAENAANFLKKGSLVGIDGKIQTGSYTDKEGKKVFTTEIIADSVQFLEPKSNRSGSPNTSQQSSEPAANYRQNNPYQNDDPVEVSDDDLPF